MVEADRSVLTLDETRRYARQIALPEVGAGGQARLLAARVVVATGRDDTAARAAADYLRAAGVGELVLLDDPPGEPEACRQALAGAAMLLNLGGGGGPLSTAAASLGVPVLSGAAGPGVIELQAGGSVAGPTQPGRAGGAAAVVLGTLAAGEALWCLLDPAVQPRSLRLPLEPERAAP